MTRPTVDQVRVLCEQGISDRAIGRQYGISATVIRKIRRSAGIPPGRQQAAPGSRRWREKYGDAYQPEPAVKVIDEARWAAALAGRRFEDAAVAAGRLLRMARPGPAMSGQSSMAHCGSW